ncbi:MAG TPA: cytochrome c [Chitinophagaceae bacterium]
MKKQLLILTVSTAILIFSNCTATKKTTAPAVAKSTYETNIQTLVMNNCSPCHIPAKGGNKKAYDNYANMKSDIDEIIRRIELNPGEKGFMPFKHPKLSDSTIAVFKQWKADGTLEK